MIGVSLKKPVLPHSSFFSRYYCFIYLRHGDLSAVSANLWANEFFDSPSARKTRPKPNQNQFCTKTFTRPEHYRRHLQTQHNEAFALPTYPCPVCPNKIFKRKDHLRKHLQSCPSFQKIIDQGEPSATHFSH